MKKYYLMAPGPTPVPPNVLLAMAQPMIHHRTPEYEALFIEVRAGLKRLFQTGQDVIPFTSSGTGAMDASGVDLVVAGSQKGLMLPPGLSFCSLSEKAWGHVKASRLPKYYFDLTAEWKAVSKNEAHFTPAVSIVLGLREVLRMIEVEG